MIFATANSIPGGWRQITDLNSPDVQKNAQKAAIMLSKSMNTPFYFKPLNITKAESQVVSGMNYRFEMSIGPTQCKKSQNVAEQEVKNCPLQKCKSPLYCSIQMYVQPWTNTNKITHSNCETGKSSC
ncbi:Cystatin-1 like protein [Argiope bruennichi]|uniref:Cystatin-1 like protein n=2 Tax=Argiope bruennichi TaxID=94029 RepID=A0A8T0G2X4_ARGBR|nr:Cystatin-1 like protein [Argiope bruennichi]